MLEHPGTASLALKLCSRAKATDNIILKPKKSSIGEREERFLCPCHLCHPNGTVMPLGVLHWTLS